MEVGMAYNDRGVCEVAIEKRGERNHVTLIAGAIDYMLKLRKSGWGEESRDKILEMAYQIKKEMKKDNFEIAELKIKDPYDDPASYL